MYCYITIVVGFVKAEYMNVQLIFPAVFEAVDEPIASNMVYVSERKLVCMFDIVERSFLSVLCFYYWLDTLSKFDLLFFLSYDFTLIKAFLWHFVMPHSIDVVSTLSYCMICECNILMLELMTVGSHMLYTMSGFYTGKILMLKHVQR